jgi:hypothetical protein
MGCRVGKESKGTAFEKTRWIPSIALLYPSQALPISLLHLGLIDLEELIYS